MKKYTLILLFFIAAASCPLFSGQNDLAFVVWSDTHFGAYDFADTTRLDIIDQINRLNTADLPEDLAAEEKGFSADFLLHCGDITENGKQTQWNDPNVPAQRSYLQTLGHLDTQIKAYAALGNHDSRKEENIRALFADLYKGTYYSFDCKGVHLAVLDPYPELNSAAPSLDTAQIDWLKADLDTLAPETPVIIVMHVLPVCDETIDRTSRLDQQSSQTLASVISDKNVLAFLHGHWHATSVKEWNGIPVIAPAGFAYYREGCMNGQPVFGIVQVTDSAFTVYSYNWENRCCEEIPLYQRQFPPKN